MQNCYKRKLWIDMKIYVFGNVTDSLDAPNPILAAIIYIVRLTHLKSKEIYMVCGNCNHGGDKSRRTKCTACKVLMTQAYNWPYCEECALDLGCCESCGDMLYTPRRPDLAKDLGLTPFFKVDQKKP